MDNAEFEAKKKENFFLLDKSSIYGDELGRYLNAIYETAAYRDYCPNGLQIAGNRKIKKIITAVSGSLETMAEAIRQGADALIVHHGIFWQGQKSVLTGALYEKVKKIMDSGIHFLAFHLPMDGHPVLGNSAVLAGALGLKNLSPFGYYKGKAIGTKGEFQSQLTSFEIKTKLEKVLEKEIMLLGKGPKKINSASIVTGGGQREFQNAIDEGDVDLFITGEVSENNYHQANEEGVWFASCGHYATEKFGPRALADFLGSLGVFTSADFLDIPNPI